MERLLKLFAFSLILYPVLVLAFEPLPKSYYKITFNTTPSSVPEILKFRIVSKSINVQQGKYNFDFDNGKNEIVIIRSKYNKIYSISRHIGIYDSVNYHFKVRDFINCFIKRYGPPDRQAVIKAMKFSQFYNYEVLEWEDGQIKMTLKTLFYTAQPQRKYWPGQNGRDIIVNYINKRNKNFVYGLDYDINSEYTCRNIW